MLEEAEINYLKARLTLTTRELRVLSFEERNRVRPTLTDIHSFRDFTNLRNNLSKQQDYFCTHGWLDPQKKKRHFIWTNSAILCPEVPNLFGVINPPKRMSACTHWNFARHSRRLQIPQSPSSGVLVEQLLNPDFEGSVRVRSTNQTSVTSVLFTGASALRRVRVERYRIGTSAWGTNMWQVADQNAEFTGKLWKLVRWLLDPSARLRI